MIIENNYDVNYFISKFEAIPEEKWTTGRYIDENGRCCAYGHCGVMPNLMTEEAKALENLFAKILQSPDHVNDNKAIHYTQETPKARILAALYDIKKQLETK